MATLDRGGEAVALREVQHATRRGGEVKELLHYLWIGMGLGFGIAIGQAAWGALLKLLNRQ